MNNHRNPIEKYDEQDRKISAFFNIAGNVFEYVSAVLIGVFYGAIAFSAFALLKEDMTLSMTNAILGGFIGGIGGFAFAKLQIMFRKKFGDDIPIVPVLLLGCLALTAVFYFIV
ncbi:MAG: hypothetical protein KDI13_00575 [Alphaproteobacteria bacterium]|nr:hypothetical protein [Alphaproteobacteria bacterium]